MDARDRARVVSMISEDSRADVKDRNVGPTHTDTADGGLAAPSVSTRVDNVD